MQAIWLANQTEFGNETITDDEPVRFPGSLCQFVAPIASGP
jgi:hypothetical protein